MSNKEIEFDNELGINVFKERNLSGSLEQANDELCDAYREYKDLVSQCSIDFQNIQSNGDEEETSEEEAPAEEQLLQTVSQESDQLQQQQKVKKAKKVNAKVFYFKPESFLVTDPEKQKQYREKLLKQIKAPPEISKAKLMADDLQESLIETVADRSDPRELRKILANYFQRKQYSLQHKRYKLMLRWAHHAIKTRNIEQLGTQATFRCSKLQWDIDNSIKRSQRLEVDDDYTLGMHPELRPTSKAKQNEGTLYVEIKDLPAQSSIRSDDIETYTRHLTYTNKVNKLVNKFMARLKWIPLSQRYQIFENMVSKYFAIRDQNIQGQEQYLIEMEEDTFKSGLKTQEIYDDLKVIKKNAHITQYQATMAESKQKLLGACRPDYQISPNLIDNTPSIKLKIASYAKLYGLSADLNQDNGYSFAYQLTLFFPTYFQKQVIKSQFSIYDAFAGNEEGLKKRNFSTMLRVDPNIFRDIATNSNLVPSEESLTEEVSRLNIQILRLKVSPWVEHVVMMPKVPDWQRRQDSLLNNEDNPIDTLLRGALDFLDVNDLASVNLVIAEASGIHLDLLSKQQNLEEKLKLSKLSKKSEKEMIYQTVSATNIQQLNNNMYIQMSNALTGASIVKNTQQKLSRQQEEKSQPPKKGGLFDLQQHLIQSHNTLRYMNSRDAKTKILYSLNYFRSIQKRINMDLREFGTCERVLGDVTNPLIPAQEADAQLIDTLNMILSNTNKAKRAVLEGSLDDKPSILDKSSMNLTKNKTSSMNVSVSMKNTLQHGDTPDHNFAILDPSQVSTMLSENSSFSLVDLKKIRLRGNFHEKHLSTCPILPRFHATFGEPSEIQPEYVQKDREEAKEEQISRGAMKYLNRIDHIEIDEKRSEVFVKDDFGIYLMYECSLSDMQILEEEFLRVGTYYISKMEDLFDTEVEKVCHKKDRQQVLNDLLNCEMHFQFRKVLLTQMFMEVYEHICDPVEQQRICQIVTDTMARRPRLNLDNLYFQDSYRAEIDCIDKNIELLDIIIQNQIKIEKTENTHLHESLNLSYSLAQKKTKDGWTYDDADVFLNNLIEKFHDAQSKKQIDLASDQKTKTSEPTLGQTLGHSQTFTKDPPKPTEILKDFQQPGFQMRNMRYTDQELDSEAFTKLLGLPKVTLEQLFQQSKDNDDVILDIMAEQSHYVNLIEGYPDLMSLKQSGRANDRNTSTSQSVDLTDLSDNMRNNKTSMKSGRGSNISASITQPEQVKELNINLNKWLTRSESMSIMDFYQDSLMFLSKLHSIITCSFNELSDILKPHDNMMRSVLEAEIYEQAIKEYRQMRQYLTGEQVETEGHQYIESEFVTGSSDKMMFYIKDLISDLNKSAKPAVNPFVVAKLDIPSIKSYKFPSEIKKSENPYKLKKDGLIDGKLISIAIAEQKFGDPNQFRQKYIDEIRKFKNRYLNFNADGSEKRSDYYLNLQTPSLLELQCNSVELLRLRNELMMCLSECVILQDLYKQQVKLSNRGSLLPLFSESLAFEHGQHDDNEMNFLDDGPASFIDIELAINEIDPVIASNLNFRSADAFKLMILNSGLEEVRVILHYQMMQKQALIVACRTNQILMDIHQRALSELELVKKGYALPNMAIQIPALFSKLSDGIDNSQHGKLKSQFSINLTNKVSPCIVSLTQWKSSQRTSLGKKYQEVLAVCEKHYWQKEVKLRVMRAYKVSLFNQYCNRICEGIYANSVKYNVLAQCQKLRSLNQYFQFNPAAMNIETTENSPKFSQLFNLETNDLIENLMDWYQPTRFVKEIEDYNKSLQHQQGIVENDEENPKKMIEFRPQKFEALDFRKREMTDILCIPCSANIVHLELFKNQAEQNKYIKSTVEKVPFEILSEDVEETRLLQQMLPNISEITPREDICPNDKHLGPRKPYTDFSTMHLAQIYRYFHHIENIITLELSISKFQFNSNDVIEMDNCIQNGMPFYQTQMDLMGYVTSDLTAIINSGKVAPEIGMTQIGKQTKENEQVSTRNLLATKILNEIVNKKRKKCDLGEELYEIGSKVKNILAEAQKHGEKQNLQSFSNEYLEQYEQIRYLQIVSTMQKLQNKYFEKQEFGAGQAIYDTLLAISKRDHVKILNSNGTFHVNASELDSSRQNIENNSFIPYYGSIQEQISFKKAIHPVLSDKALEPMELTLLESIYLNNSSQNPSSLGRLEYKDYNFFRKGNFAGQNMCITPFSDSDLTPIQSQLLCMHSSQRKYISSNLKQAEPLLREYLQFIVNETVLETLTFNQLKKSRRFLIDHIESQQLFQAQLIFYGHQVPTKLRKDKETMKKINDQFLKNFFWMILKEKDMLKEAQDARYRSSMTEKQMYEAQKNLEAEIFRLKKMDERKITDEDLSNAQKLKIQALEQEQRKMKRNVLMDSILTSRAEIVVHTAEVERFLIASAVRCLDGETAALANCLKNQSQEVDAHVHPFQQFAVTLYDKVDPKSHLDAINKCSHIQQFMTRLKNRGTEVETLTSGPGYVFTLKDINDCVGTLSRGLLKYSETELRSKAEFAAKKEQHYQELLYCKDQQIENLERRLAEQTRIVDKMVNSRMYEKGNAIVYELDQSNRSLKLLKDNLHLMEENIRKEIDFQFKNKLTHREANLQKEMKKFNDFKQDFIAQMNYQVTEDQEHIKKMIRKKADQFKNLENESPGKYLINRQKVQPKQPQPKDIWSSTAKKMNDFGQEQIVMSEGDEIIDEPYEFPKQLQDVYAMNEIEAREELALLCDRTRLMFVFWKVKEITMRQKYEDQIFNLNQKLSSNSMLWEQLAEAEKREHILRQELILTQQGLSNCEKIVEKQRDHINKLDTEKVRLQNFKQNKGRRLDELEKKVSQYETFEKINVEKLIQVLDKQDKELQALRADSTNYKHHLENIKKRNRHELQEAHKKFKTESDLKNLAVMNLENMRQEIQALETTNSNQHQWKEKCQELYDISIQLKEENAYLVDRCKQIAGLAVNMMSQLNDQQTQTTPGVVEQPVIEKYTQHLKNVRRQSKDLPKLMASQNQISHREHSLLLEESSVMRNFEYPPSRTKSRVKKHNRGRSLLEIKNEITQQKMQSAVFGKSISKERKNDDSLLETSVMSSKSRDTSNKLGGGFSSSTNKGFAGIFGHSSMADYSQNIKKIKNMSIIDANFKVTTKAKQASMQQQEFYNMKAKMGISKLYPEKGNNEDMLPVLSSKNIGSKKTLLVDPQKTYMSPEPFTPGQSQDQFKNPKYF